MEGTPMNEHTLTADVLRRMRAPSLLSCCIESLKRARTDAVAAGAPKAANKIRRALKSAEGALRNAENHSPLLRGDTK